MRVDGLGRVDFYQSGGIEVFVVVVLFGIVGGCDVVGVDLGEGIVSREDEESGSREEGREGRN